MRLDDRARSRGRLPEKRNEQRAGTDIHGAILVSSVVSSRACERGPEMYKKDHPLRPRWHVRARVPPTGGARLGPRFKIAQATRHRKRSRKDGLIFQTSFDYLSEVFHDFALLGVISLNTRSS